MQEGLGQTFTVSSGNAFDLAAATVSPVQLAPGNYTFQYAVVKYVFLRIQ